MATHTYAHGDRFKKRWSPQELERLRIVWLNAPAGHKGSVAHDYLEEHFPNRGDLSYGLLKLRKRKLIPRLKSCSYNISATDLQFLATCVETEGCIHIRPHSSGKAHAELCIVSNTDKEFIDAVHRVVPNSHIVTRNLPPPRQTLYLVTLTRHGEIIPLLRLLLPYIYGKKRHLAQEVIDRFNESLV